MELIIENDNLSTIIDELSRDPHAFDAVDVLVFKDCHNLTYLPEAIFENLTNLRSLNFDGCRSLMSVGDSFFLFVVHILFMVGRSVHHFSP